MKLCRKEHMVSVYYGIEGFSTALAGLCISIEE